MRARAWPFTWFRASSKVNSTTVLNAMGQAFFSPSLGMGAPITYGSYVREDEILFTSTSLLALSDDGIALLAGLMIFLLVSYIHAGDMSYMAAGPGLIFQTLPIAFQTIEGTMGMVLGTLFFVLLCFAGLISTISLLEVPVAYVVDEHGLRRSVAVWLVAGIVFVVGLPSLVSNGYSCYFTEFITHPGATQPTNFLGFILNIANDSFLPLGGCLIVGFAAHIWKQNHLMEELSKGAPGFATSTYSRYLLLVLPYLIPVVLLAIFLLTILRTFVALDF